MKRIPVSALAATVLLYGLAVTTPALARPGLTPDASPSPLEEDTELPTDGRPIVATVVAIDQDGLRVMLSTPHGPVALSVSREVVDHLHVGDVVVVHFTSEDDFPSASPPGEEPARSERLTI
jgi:hypothetical protein